MANIIKKPTDPAIKYTDAEIKILDEKIQLLYGEAQSDIQKKLNDFTTKFKKKDLEYSSLLANGKITKEEYAAWRKGQVFTGKQWVQKKKEIAAVLDNSNKIATAMVNQSAISVLGENLNFMGYSLEHTAGVNFGFGLYNQEAVTKLVKDDPQLLPKWKINEKKDYTWNQKNLNNALSQGIIQGESLDKISKRVSTSLASKNENLMKTFAKTGMTQAQNSGRLERLQQAETLGIKVKKKWVATLDNRTRIEHQQLDGQTAKIDGEFSVGGMKIRYPGDPEAHPSLVYNCRCAVDADFEEYPATYDRYDNIAGAPIKGMSYKQWKEAKAKGDKLSPVPLTYKTFKDKEQKILEELFKSKSMSKLFYEIKDYDSKTANSFYKVLGENGKQSENWKKYLDGTMPPSQAKKIDDLLTAYGKDSGLIKDSVDFVDMFKGTKVSNIYHEMSEIDKTAANKFYKDLQKMDANNKASNVWSKYLAGELSEDDVNIIEYYLEKHAKKLDKVTVTPAIKATKKAEEITKATIDYSAVGGKEAYNILSKYDNLDDFLVNCPSHQQKIVIDAFKGQPMSKLNDAFDEVKQIKVKEKSAKLVAKASDEAENAVKLEKAQKKLKNLEDEMKDLDNDLAKVVNKTYSGIWKDDVTLADYEDKKSKIAAKKKYYEEQIEKYKGPAYANIDWAPNEIKKMEDHLKDLKEFETLGKKHASEIAEKQAAKKQLEKNIAAAQKEVKKYTPTLSQYGQDRLNNAAWPVSRVEADKLLRDSAGKVWRNASKAEKDAIYEYTKSYHKFNEPLRGQHYGTGAFKGVGKTDLNAGSMNNGKRLNALTDLLNKADLPQDEWFQRGVNYSGMDKFFNVSSNLLENGTQLELEEALLGTTPIEHAFTSMGSAKGDGFSESPIIMNIFAPKGTKAMYIEPISAFGSGAKLNWDGISKQTSFGGELETLLQQGTRFRITKVERARNRLYIDMEIIDQSQIQKWTP